jgi:hypothetical protein
MNRVQVTVKKTGVTSAFTGDSSTRITILNEEGCGIEIEYDIACFKFLQDSECSMLKYDDIEVTLQRFFDEFVNIRHDCMIESSNESTWTPRLSLRNRTLEYTLELDFTVASYFKRTPTDLDDIIVRRVVPYLEGALRDSSNVTAKS